MLFYSTFLLPPPIVVFGCHIFHKPILMFDLQCRMTRTLIQVFFRSHIQLTSWHATWHLIFS